MNWFEATNFRDKALSTLVLYIKIIGQGLVRGRKYSQRQGFRKSRENFSHTNKSWFTIF